MLGASTPSSGAAGGGLIQPATQQAWNGFKTGVYDDIADQVDGLARAGKALRRDPIGAALKGVLQTIPLLTPSGQGQALLQVGQQAYRSAQGVGQDYQAAAHSGTLPYFFGDLGGHAAVRGVEIAVAKGVGDACVAAPEFLNEGVYEFPDQLNGGASYVGQTNNFPRRLSEHVTEGRHVPGTETLTRVPGGKTAREIAEHNRIQELTGGQKAKNSALVANKRDPIGAARRSKFGLPEPWD
jgi:hypothetical protein